jgi:hypothetical protein
MTSLTSLTWTLAEGNTAGPALAIVFGLLVLASLVAIFLPGVRRTNALFAPVLVMVTLLITGVVLGSVLYLVHKLNLVN